jgi:hypothetical protein
MVVLGVILLICGFVFGIQLLWIVGLVLLLLGLVVNFVPWGGSTRRWY